MNKVTVVIETADAQESASTAEFFKFLDDKGVFKMIDLRIEDK